MRGVCADRASAIDACAKAGHGVRRTTRAVPNRQHEPENALPTHAQHWHRPTSGAGLVKAQTGHHTHTPYDLVQNLQAPYWPTLPLV